MKKILLLLSIVCLTSTITNAQKAKFGAKMGLNLSNIAGDYSNSKYALYYHLGIFTDISFSEKLSFQPELLYSVMGYRHNENVNTFQFDPFISDGSFKVNIKHNYLSIPLIFKLHLNQKFHFELGPQIGFLINSVQKIKESPFPDNGENTSRYPGDFHFDGGVALGTGIKITDKIGANLRYYRGLKNLLNDSIINIKTYNSVFQLSASYSIF